MTSRSRPKDILFATAGRLFYRQGFRATGVDTIAAESGIGKMTLYRHYPSKDDLIVAYLQASDQAFWGHFEASTAAATDPREQLLAFFEALQGYALTPDCHGCPFLNVASEYPAPDYPGHALALAHKRAVRERFLRLAVAAGAQQAAPLADALVLLMDGAYAAARVFGASADSPAAHLAAAARRLIDAHCGDTRPPAAPADPAAASTK